MVKVKNVWVKEPSPDVIPLAIPEATLDTATGIFYFNDTKCVHVSNVRSWTEVADIAPVPPKKLTEPEQATVAAIKSKLRKQ